MELSRLTFSFKSGGQSSGFTLNFFTYKTCLIILSAFLYFLTLPPVDFGLIAWFALVPFILSLSNLNLLSAFTLGCLFGFIVKSLVFNWLWDVQGFGIQHHLVLAMFFSLYYGLFAVIVNCFSEKKNSAILIASTWVLMDYAMANSSFMSLSWGTLAHTQHENLPLIQIASFVGEYGVTFVVFMGNVALVQIVKRANVFIAFIIFMGIVLVHIFGYLKINDSQSDRKIIIGVIQPAFLPDTEGYRRTNTESFGILEKLTLEASKNDLDLIIWPESSFDRWKSEPELISDIQNLARTIKTPILFGSSDGRKFSEQSDSGDSVQLLFNSVYLIRANGLFSEAYNKNILLPFAEYVPLTKLISWPDWLVPKFDSMIAGTESKSFELSSGVVLNPIICWENTFPNFVRNTVGDKPTLIAHLVNDNLFGNNAGAYQHNLSSIFRAVENDVPIAIASNTGPSQIIDANGRVVQELPNLFESGLIVAEINLNQNRSFYSKFGDVFILLLIIYFFSTICLRVSNINETG